MLVAAVVLPLVGGGCRAESVTESPARPEGAEVLNAGFVVTNGVFNSELMAPYDVLHHSIFRDSLSYIEPFIVSENGRAVTTFEGIVVDAHYSFATAPEIDILVVPSTVGSMDADLENEVLLEWLSSAAERASWVITLCDGAFTLAATGLLDGRIATTFPADRAALKERFPAVDVLFDQRFVADGKFITSVGGGMSYEPAFYLVERLYGAEHARATAEGLVWAWDLSAVPHRVVP